jgi:geranylgeranyl diphosphate synthase type I
MSLELLTKSMLPAIEVELRHAVSSAGKTTSGITNGLEELHHMIAYHMGWEGEGAGPEAQGKHVRPLLVLLSTAAAGGEWEQALPAAAAVELVHNFSLIHDDIEDNSPLRRGRPTVWKKWGIAQAVNAGDTLFTLAHLALLRLAETTTPTVAFMATHILQKNCLHLTQGQYLDLAYTTKDNLIVADYWPMVEGKTAALLAACTELGALIATAEKPAGASIRQDYREFGHLLGLAFQVQDDLLGIWGNSVATGKSAESDLVEGKKSLPVLVGISYQGPFAKRWQRGLITPEEVPGLATQLEAEGVRTYIQTIADRLVGEALEALENTPPRGDAGEALRELTIKLLNRER